MVFWDEIGVALVANDIKYSIRSVVLKAHYHNWSIPWASRAAAWEFKSFPFISLSFLLVSRNFPINSYFVQKHTEAKSVKHHRTSPSLYLDENEKVMPHYPVVSCRFMSGIRFLPRLS